VLRLHAFCLDWPDAVMLMDYFAEASAVDGRWDRLRVLDLTDCAVGDIGLSQLAAAIEAGFGKGLEEIDLTLTHNIIDRCAECDAHTCRRGKLDTILKPLHHALPTKKTGSASAPAGRACAPWARRCA